MGGFLTVRQGSTLLQADSYLTLANSEIHFYVVSLLPSSGVPG